MASTMRAQFPSRSPTVGLIWARPMRRRRMRPECGGRPAAWQTPRSPRGRGGNENARLVPGDPVSCGGAAGPTACARETWSVGSCVPRSRSNPGSGRDLAGPCLYWPVRAPAARWSRLTGPAPRSGICKGRAFRTLDRIVLVSDCECVANDFQWGSSPMPCWRIPAITCGVTHPRRADRPVLEDHNTLSRIGLRGPKVAVCRPVSPVPGWCEPARPRTSPPPRGR